MAWKKIEVEKISDPEMDVGDYLAMALQVALPIAGGALGASIAGPALAAKGMAIGAGAGQAVGQFATAALQDDPREAQRYLGQGMQAAFTTLPYAVDAYEQYQKDKIPPPKGIVADAPLKGALSAPTQQHMSLTGQPPLNPYGSLSLGGAGSHQESVFTPSLTVAPLSLQLDAASNSLLNDYELADIYGTYG